MRYKKAEHVRQILSVLAVNAGNPSIVLTQDQSRGLLAADKARFGPVAMICMVLVCDDAPHAC